jgi:hypothetical protein
MFFPQDAVHRVTGFDSGADYRLGGPVGDRHWVKGTVSALVVHNRIFTKELQRRGTRSLRKFNRDRKIGFALT